MPRWMLACDQCSYSVWTGGEGESREAWCEACQEIAALREADARCPLCQRELKAGEPRFVEWLGELRHLDAVLAAWEGNSAPLAELLPERPSFLSDLNPPPARPEDPAEVKQAFSALEHGRFGEARERLERLTASAGEPRWWRALAIACERRGDCAAAEAALDSLGEAGGEVAHLQRGALLARRGEFTRARAEFARAGAGFEAGWNRAAVIVALALEARPAGPDPADLAAARREAGPPSIEWCDHTVGRLLWTLLIERANGTAETASDTAGVLRAAEREIEFDTFWDRALVLEGYARLALAGDAARIAAPLARELARRLAAEPGLASPGAASIAEALTAASREIEGARPHGARGMIERLMRRPDLLHYRVPCRRCGRGSIGIAEVDETEAERAPVPG